MNNVFQHYIIDLSSNNNFVQIPTVQGDGNNIRGFEVELIENGVQYEIDKNDCIIVIMGTKPDTSQIMNDCKLTDEGYILVDITSQMSAVKGRGDYQIVLMSRSTNSQLKSFPFHILTTPAAFDIDHIVSSDEFQSLTRNIIRTEEVIEEANDAISDMWDLESSVEKAEKARVESEKGRVNAEKNRVSAESTRQSNENTRNTNEVARQSAETNRNNAETERENAEGTRMSNENTRQNNETTRQSNENIRQINTTTAITNADKAIERANTATERANNAATVCEGIIGESGIVAQKATEAANSATSADTSAANAKTSEKNAKTSETNASKSKTAAATSATNAANSATVADEKATEASNYSEQAKSYAVGGTGTRTDEDIDNAKYYYEQAKGISTGLAGTLMPMGTVTFAKLPALSSAQSGWMYNISNEFTTTSNFKEGSGHVIPAGANVYKTADGKWDILAGTPVTSVNGQTGNVIIDTESFPTQIVTTAGTNLNDYITPGIYYFSSTYKPINIPTGVNGWLIVLTDGSTMVKQIWMRHGTAGSNDHMTYVRMLSGSTWGDWKRYAMSDEVDAKISKSGDTMEGILNLKDELRINDGVTNRRVLLLRNPQTYGVKVLLGGGGNVFVGSGESYYTLQEDLGNEEVTFASEISYGTSSERLYLCSDNGLYLLANCNSHGTAIGYWITTEGHLVPTGQNQNIGNDNHTLDTVYADELTGNAATASKWKTAQNINGMSIDGSASRTNYGSCSTAAATAAKTVACDGFTLVTGAEITVKFTVTNTAASPTLNVNSTGAKPIYYRGAAITAGYLAANRTYTFRYNGTQYDLVGDVDTNTKYTAASTVPHMDGTAAVGTSAKYAREDHVHPTDTSRAAADHNHDSAYAAKNHSHDYLPLTGGILKGHLNVNTDNTWIFGGSDKNLLNIYTRNIEATTSDYLYIKAPKTIEILCDDYVSAKKLDGSAHVTIYAKAFTTLSSRKVKENIQNMTDEEASKILDIDVVTFDYLARVGGDKDQRGCIAEDVYKIIPSVVSIPDEYDDTEEFEDGKIPHVPGIDYSKFVPYLIKMVQIQNERIDNLEKEIEMLKNR